MLGADNKDIRASVATSLLNRGFKMLENGTEPVVINNQNSTANTTYAAPTNTTTQPTQTNTKKMSAGSAGVQFGAFSSYDAAARQVKNVEQTLFVRPSIERASGGLYRVRLNNIAESAAQDLRNSATAAGIDSYVFH